MQTNEKGSNAPSLIKPRKSFVNKVVGSRGIVLHEFTSEDFNEAREILGFFIFDLIILYISQGELYTLKTVHHVMVLC